MSGLDLAAIRARAARHAQLERDAGRDITLTEVSAAICSADDVPALLAEIGRLTRTELAEVTAERDRYRQSLPVEAQDYWYWRQRAETAEARVDEMADAHVEIARLTDGWRTTDHLRDEWRQRADGDTADLDAALVTIGALADELATARRDADHELCLTQLREYAEGAQADLATERAHVERLKQVALSRLNEIYGLQAQLVQAEEYAREAGDTASMVEANADQDCRDAAADALDWAADQAAGARIGSAASLRRWATKVRTGQRTIPTQPATTTEDLPEWERELLNRQEESG
jgi:hypothetical protein